MGIARNNVCVVLVEPTLPQNVGSVARAMNNMGVNDLRLVNPCTFQNREARQTAAHSLKILRNAKVYASLTEAVPNVQLILGTTARLRDRSARITRLPELGNLIPETVRKIALVFGRESRGLTNAEDLGLQCVGPHSHLR